MTRKTALAYSSAIALTWLPSAAQAQEAPAAFNQAALEDIVVTAAKREQRLQDVPIAISAIGANTLQTNRIGSAQDLQFLAPSLVYNELGGFAQPFLRGIGTDIASTNVDPSVATYVDGAFIADSQSTMMNLLGVERIEVVSGPQGTLYGRNAIGGAINIITLTPKQELEARVSATAGNYDTFEGSARVSGGVTDRLAIGLYAAATSRNSYYDRLGPQVKSLYPPLTRTGDREHHRTYGTRFKAHWEPVDDLRLIGSVDYLRSKSPDLTAFRQVQPTSFGFAVFGAPVQIRDWQIQSDYLYDNSFKHLTTTLREELDIGEHQLVGITSYHKTEGFTANDIDATSAAIFGNSANLRNKHFSQELQLLSPKGEALEYIVGAYYFTQRSREAISSQSPILLAPGTTASGDARVHTQSIAGFGQVTYSPVDKLRLTLGGRYTREQKKMVSATSTLLDANNTALLTTVFDPAKQTYSEFTPKASIDYRVGSTLLYASYSKGFKSGAYNLASPGNAPVDPEKLTAYEIGSKSDFADGQIRFNLAGYYYDFKDLQVQVLTGGGQSVSIYLNAADAKAYGVEASVMVAVTPELRLSGQLAWEHSEYKNFLNFPAYVPAAVGNVQVPTNVSGNELQRAPEWVGNAAIDYTHEIGDGSKIAAGINFYYNDGFYWSPANDLRQRRYGLLNAYASYTLPNTQWTIGLYGTNLTKKHYEVVRFPTPFGTNATDGTPRTYGVSLTYEY